MRVRVVHPRAAAAAALLVFSSTALVACGDGANQEGPSALPSASTSAPTTLPSLVPSVEPSASFPSSPVPAQSSPVPAQPSLVPSVPQVVSAAEQLSGYFAAAERADARLREVARVVNQSVTADGASFDPATVSLLRAADPASFESLLPAGMPADLLRSTLLVHSDLLSRYAALRWVEPGQLPPQQVEQLVECLSNGGPAARRFAGDLTAARLVAADTPELPNTPMSSQASKELAVRLASLHLANTGCGACGGSVAQTLLPVVWDSDTSGRIAETGFTLRLVAGRWDVAFDVC